MRKQGGEQVWFMGLRRSQASTALYINFYHPPVFIPHLAMFSVSCVVKLVTNLEPVLHSAGQVSSFLINFPFDCLSWLTAPTLLKQEMRSWI